MNQKVKIVVVATIVVVALLAIVWASASRPLPGMERLEWGRWDLTEEQRNEVEQLIEDLRKNGTSWRRIKAAVDAKLGGWEVKPPPLGDIELFYTAKTAISSVNTGCPSHCNFPAPLRLMSFIGIGSIKLPWKCLPIRI